MYLGELGGVPKTCKAVSDLAPRYQAWGYHQDWINRVWSAMGYPDPAPILPASMHGMFLIQTRGPRMLSTDPGDRSVKKGARGVTKEENKFLNFWGKHVSDVCREQSTISKIAGGILQVASIAIPTMGVMNAVATAGNAGLAMQGAKRDAKEAERIMAPAYELQAKQDQAKAEADLAAKLAAMQALRPTSNAQPVGVVTKSQVEERSGWTSTEIGVAALAAGALLLGVMQK